MTIAVEWSSLGWFVAGFLIGGVILFVAGVKAGINR